MDYIKHITNLLVRNEAIVEEVKLDHISLDSENTSLCHLCLNLIYDKTWRIWEISKYSKARYDFHPICYHSLLTMAGYSKSGVSQAIEKNQRILQLHHYKNSDFTTTH